MPLLWRDEADGQTLGQSLGYTLIIYLVQQERCRGKLAQRDAESAILDGYRIAAGYAAQVYGLCCAVNVGGQRYLALAVVTAFLPQAEQFAVAIGIVAVCCH